MKLLRNGSLDGTFSLVVKTAIENLLLIDKPFQASIAVGHRRGRVVGRVAEVTRDLTVTIDTEAGTEYLPLNMIDIFEVLGAEK